MANMNQIMQHDKGDWIGEFGQIEFHPAEITDPVNWIQVSDVHGKLYYTVSTEDGCLVYRFTDQYTGSRFTVKQDIPGHDWHVASMDGIAMGETRESSNPFVALAQLLWLLG